MTKVSRIAELGDQYVKKFQAFLNIVNGYHCRAINFYMYKSKVISTERPENHLIIGKTKVIAFFEHLFHTVWEMRLLNYYI